MKFHRTHLSWNLLLLLTTFLPLPALSALGNESPRGPFFGNGIKVGEVDSTSAIVWIRLTQTPTADFQRLPIFTEGLRPERKDEGEMPADVLPGSDGEVRVHYWIASGDRQHSSRSSRSSRGQATQFQFQFQFGGQATNNRLDDSRGQAKAWLGDRQKRG